MKGGLATSSIALPSGLIVAALVAVNAVGDVVEPETGRVIAGVRTANGSAIDDIKALVRSGARPRAAVGGNTTLAVVTTNATLTKAQAKRSSSTRCTAATCTPNRSSATAPLRSSS